MKSFVLLFNFTHSLGNHVINSDWIISVITFLSNVDTGNISFVHFFRKPGHNFNELFFFPHGPPGAVDSRSNCASHAEAAQILHADRSSGLERGHLRPQISQSLRIGFRAADHDVGHDPPWFPSRLGFRSHQDVRTRKGESDAKKNWEIFSWLIWDPVNFESSSFKVFFFLLPYLIRKQWVWVCCEAYFENGSTSPLCQRNRTLWRTFRRASSVAPRRVKCSDPARVLSSTLNWFQRKRRLIGAAASPNSKKIFQTT